MIELIFDIDDSDLCNKDFYPLMRSRNHSFLWYFVYEKISNTII